MPVPAAPAIRKSRSLRPRADRRVCASYTPREGSRGGSQRRPRRMSSVVTTSTVSWVRARSGAENQMKVTQLIARRLRELGVYCEIHPYQTITDARLAELAPRAVIFSGGPDSVTRAG